MMLLLQATTLQSPLSHNNVGVWRHSGFK